MSVLATLIEIVIIRTQSSIAGGVLGFLLHLYRISLQVSTAIMLMKSTFFMKKQYDEFLVKLWNINPKISWFQSTDLSRIILPYSFFVVLLILYTGYTTCSTFGIKFYILHILEIFQSIHGLIILTVIISLVRCIRFHFSAITDELLKHQSIEKMQEWNEVSVIELKMKKTKRIRNIQELTFLHDEVCNLVDNFNALFGVYSLLTMFLCFINILIHAGSFSAYVLNEPLHETQEWSVSTTIVAFQYTIICTVLPIILAHECSCVVAEGKKLVATCFSCSSRLPLIPQTPEDKLFEKSLSVLCHQAETRMPQFSAGGFFTIDYSMLASMVGSLTANMIIILQFMQINKN
ncbi:hypothetical protein WA026_002931 [Henosepilachna vigintioctopunctata]|uniref:Gustatory receptor n=1 Tax=Henosepilachna vigintioctopunctata TaxID=420089 RepID=A0AAW1TLR5_9CUCU